MRDSRRRSAGDGEDDAGEPWLAELLRSEADTHEPDLAALRRRLASRRNAAGGTVPGTARGASLGSRASVRTASRSASRTAKAPAKGPPKTAVPGQRRGAAWAAAGFVLATTAGGLAVAAVSGVLAAGGHSTGPVRVVPGQSTTGTAPPSEVTAPPAPAGTPSTTPATPSTPARPNPPTTPTATGEPAATVAPLAVTAAAGGTRVDLADGRERDWVVAGPEPNATVRSRSGGQVLGGPHVVGDPRTAVAPGPFRTTWTGGSPAASGSAVRGWLTVSGRPGGPRTGFLVSVPSAATSLTLHVGAGPSGGRVTVKPSGGAGATTTLPPSSADAAGGHVVTVRLDGSGGRTEVLVDAPGGGTVAFAAAVLR